MDQATYDRGLEIRKSVLGKEFVDKAINSATDFTPSVGGTVSAWVEFPMRVTPAKSLIGSYGRWACTAAPMANWLESISTV